MPNPFSSDYYDAANQYATWSSSNDRERQRRALKSRLRFDFLFSGNITLARADVLDGASFMHTTPQEIRNWLALENAATSPITIMTRTGSLESDLLGWVQKPDLNVLHAEPFLVVPQTLSPEFSKEFSRLPSSKVNNWRDLATVIATVVGKNDLSSMLQDYWGSWLEQAPKCFNVVHFPQSFDYASSLPNTLDYDVLQAYGIKPHTDESDIAISLYNEAISAFAKSRWQRGELMKWLDQNLPKNSNVAVAVRDQINIWICRVRSRANKTSHETFSPAALSESSINKSVLRWLTDDPVARNQTESVQIGIPQHLAEWLPECDYANLLRDTHISRMNWLRTNNAESLKKFADTIVKSISKDPGPLAYEPSPFVVNIVRAVAATGGAIIAAHWDLTPGQGWYDGLKIIGGSIAGQWVSSKEHLNTVVGKLHNRYIIHQILQSVRPREAITIKEKQGKGTRKRKRN